MNSYKLRALSLKGEPVLFDVTDIPVKISETTFVLAAKPDTPIMWANTISRGTEDGSFFEGDVVKYNDICYRIIFNRGFKAVTAEKEEVRYLREIQGAEVISYGASSASSLVYRARGRSFLLGDIIGAYSGFALVSTLKEKVDPVEFQQDAGFSVCRNRLFYGDPYNGSWLVMKSGRPCVRVDGEYVDITRKENK